MRRAWPYLAVIVGLIAVGWLAQVHTLAFGWMARPVVGERSEDWEEAKRYVYTPSAERLPLGGESDVADLTYTSDIALENLWDPFMISGPVKEIEWIVAGLVGGVLIRDVTNLPGLQPLWWDPATLCGALIDGQIWRVDVSPELVPGLPAGWFFVCDPTSPYEIEATVEFFNVTKIACQWHYDATSSITATVKPMMDKDGSAWTLTGNGRPLEWTATPVGILGRTIYWKGCLHKGTADNNYITQEFGCDDYTIDIGDWYEPFGGSDYLGYAESARVAKWKALQDSVADDCADGVWILGPAPRRLAMDRDPMNVEWLVGIQGSDIVVMFRETDLTTWSTPVVVDNTGEYDSVEISHPGSVILVVARRSCDHEFCEWYSHDRGANWYGSHVIT